MAAEWRVKRWQAQVPEAALRAAFDLAPERFADHARQRVRVVVPPSPSQRPYPE